METEVLFFEDPFQKRFQLITPHGDKKDASKDIMIVKRYKLTYGLATLN